MSGPLRITAEVEGADAALEMAAMLDELSGAVAAFERREAEGKNPALKSEVINILAQNTTVKEPDLYQRMRVPGYDTNGRVNVTSLKRMYADFVDIGYIQNPEKVKVESLVDNSFVDFAAQKLGPYKK